MVFVMSKIAIIKNKDLLRNKIANTIMEKLPTKIITCYDEKECSLLFEKNSTLDLVIIDLNIDVNIFKLIEFHLNKDVKIIIWAAETGESKLIKLFRFGLHGYFHNEMETSELIFGIKSILNGDKYIHPKLFPILLKNYMKLAGKQLDRPIGKLTKREWEVLELIVQGCKNECIGDELFISSKTVTNHVASILRKLNVQDRTNAALFALRNGWFTL